MPAVDGVREKYQLGFIRIYDAPVSAAWQAWADPGKFARWWGLKNYTSHANKIDFHIGGKFLWNMRSPEGRDYFSAGIYREVIPQKRIVISRYFSDAGGNQVPPTQHDLPGGWSGDTVITISFVELDNKVRMTLHESGIPEEAIEAAVAGWNGSLDKFNAALR
jgi:uncharacterized protein YndB with AHSA1/START domain